MRYPYCYGYWKKYADMERRFDFIKETEEVRQCGERELFLPSFQFQPQHALCREQGVLPVSLKGECACLWQPQGEGAGSRICKCKGGGNPPGFPLQSLQIQFSFCAQVFQRGLQSIPLSMDLWIHYISFLQTTLDMNHPDSAQKISGCVARGRGSRLGVVGKAGPALPPPHPLLEKHQGTPTGFPNCSQRIVCYMAWRP